MTLPKKYYVEVHRSDGAIDTIEVKATSHDQAYQQVLDTCPDDYVQHARRPNQFRRSLREHFPRSRLARETASITGQYRFQHKGKKRRGMKNYPTPKGGWRKYYPPVTFSYTVHYGQSTKEFFTRWLEALFPDDDAAREWRQQYVKDNVQSVYLEAPERPLP